MKLIYSKLDTPIGDMVTVATGEGIVLLEFVDCIDFNERGAEMENYFKVYLSAGENGTIRDLQRELGEYFEGNRKCFTMKTVLTGTLFQNRVWEELARVPYGNTISYTEQAKRLKMEGSVRAVAAANGQNKIAILTPCHRVIGKNGNLTGYAGGLQRKKWLLNMEKGVQPTLFE